MGSLLPSTGSTTTKLAWDEPVIFAREHGGGMRSIEEVSPRSAQSFYR
jgi:hypothetical protein